MDKQNPWFPARVGVNAGLSVWINRTLGFQLKWV